MEKFGLILKHIKVLYYAFIVVIILDMGYQMYTFRFTDIVKSFNEGYNAGYDEGYNLTTNKASDHGYKTSDTLHSLKKNRIQMFLPPRVSKFREIRLPPTLGLTKRLTSVSVGSCTIYIITITTIKTAFKRFS